MSARRSPVERDARAMAAEALEEAWRERRDDDTALSVYREATRSREQRTTWAVQRGDVPQARRQARAAELLDEAKRRLLARQRRDRARALAQAGIVAGARVVVVKAGYIATSVPVGTVLTLADETPEAYLYGTDDDGRQWSAYYGDVAVVPDAPADEPPMPHDDEHSHAAEPMPARRPYRAPLREPGDVWRIK